MRQRSRQRESLCSTDGESVWTVVVVLVTTVALALSALHEPPYTEPYVRWCGRTAEGDSASYPISHEGRFDFHRGRHLSFPKDFCKGSLTFKSAGNKLSASPNHRSRNGLTPKASSGLPHARSLTSRINISTYFEANRCLDLLMQRKNGHENLQCFSIVVLCIHWL